MSCDCFNQETTFYMFLGKDIDFGGNDGHRIVEYVCLNQRQGFVCIIHINLI